MVNKPRGAGEELARLVPLVNADHNGTELEATYLEAERLAGRGPLTR